MNVYNIEINTVVMYTKFEFLQMTLVETNLVGRIRPVW